jgi:Cu-Zn family superoxide dismutase
MPGRAIRHGAASLALVSFLISPPIPPPLAAAAAADPVPAAAHAQLIGLDGKPAGTATLTAQGDHLRVEVSASGLSPGFHGLHIHERGVCDPAPTPTPFRGAGGHLGNQNGPHASHRGDLPSLFVRRDGTGRARFLTDRATLSQILDADGSAIVVHAGRDNFANIPGRYQSPDSSVLSPADATTLATGDAGDRALCGVVMPGAAATPGGYTRVASEGGVFA